MLTLGLHSATAANIQWKSLENSFALFSPTEHSTFTPFNMAPRNVDMARTFRCSQSELAQLKSAFQYQLQNFLIGGRPFLGQLAGEVDRDGSIRQDLWDEVAASDEILQALLMGARWGRNVPATFTRDVQKAKKRILQDLTTLKRKSLARRYRTECESVDDGERPITIFGDSGSGPGTQRETRLSTRRREVVADSGNQVQRQDSPQTSRDGSRSSVSQTPAPTTSMEDPFVSELGEAQAAALQGLKNYQLPPHRSRSVSPSTVSPHTIARPRRRPSQRPSSTASSARYRLGRSLLATSGRLAGRPASEVRLRSLEREFTAVQGRLTELMNSVVYSSELDDLDATMRRCVEALFAERDARIADLSSQLDALRSERLL